MPVFSVKSKQKLERVHPKLREVIEETIKLTDFIVLEGIRDIETQRQYVLQGKSKTLNSKHLEQQDGYAHAVDIAPYPIDWSNIERFTYLAGIILGIAHEKGVKIRWGHDWDRDGDITDQTFNDSPHFEIIV